MKKCVKVSTRIIICIFLALNLTSCRSAHELNKLAIVMGVGVDKGKDVDPIQMTVQIANVSGATASKNTSKSSSGGASNTSYLNLEENGRGISEISKNFSRKLNRRLFFSHNQIIIFGNSAAEAGIKNYIDFFLRNRETRLLVWVLVAKGPASEILNIPPELETNPGRNIGELIKNEQDRSQIPAVNLKEFSSKLMSKTTAPTAPMIQASIDKNTKQMTAYLLNTAVFKKDKMVGTLDKKETRGLLWCTNKVKDGAIVINPQDGSDTVTIETTRAVSKITAKIKDNEPSIKIEIKQEGDLDEQTSSKNLANPKAFTALEKAESEVIKNEIMIALKKSRELNADIFGFGDTIYQHYPKQWSKIEKNWDEIYQNIHVDIRVDTKLRRTGRITKPILSNEE